MHYCIQLFLYRLHLKSVIAENEAVLDYVSSTALFVVHSRMAHF